MSAVSRPRAGAATAAASGGIDAAARSLRAERDDGRREAPAWEAMVPASGAGGGPDANVAAANLRPLPLTGVLDLPFGVLRRNAATLLAAVLLVLLPLAALGSGSLLAVLTATVELQQADPGDPLATAELERLGEQLAGLWAVYALVAGPLILVVGVRVLLADQFGARLSLRGALLSRPARVPAVLGVLALLAAGVGGLLVLAAAAVALVPAAALLVVPAVLVGLVPLSGLVGLAPVVAAAEHGGPFRALGAALGA